MKNLLEIRKKDTFLINNLVAENWDPLIGQEDTPFKSSNGSFVGDVNYEH